MYPGLEELVETTCTTLLMNIAVAFENSFDEIKLGNYIKLQRLEQSSYLCHYPVFLVVDKFPFGSLQIDKLAEAGRHNIEKSFSD